MSVDADREPDVFEQARIVREQVARARVEHRVDWHFVSKVEAVLDVLLDANATYSTIFEDGGCSPMMVERDALVRALYAGTHRPGTVLRG